MHRTRIILMASAALLMGAPMAAAAGTSTPSQNTATTANSSSKDTASSASKGTASSAADAKSDTAGAKAKLILLPNWHPDLTRDNTISVDQLLDYDVYGPTGEDIGGVENVLMSKDGKVLSVIAEVGGFLDIGDTHVNVPWDQVKVDEANKRVTIPVTQDTVEDYTLFTDEIVAAGAAATKIEEVSGDNLGLVNTASRVWQARELIGDYVRLRDGDSFVNYGRLDDVLIRDGKIEAVVVRPDVNWRRPGVYAYPYYGYGYGWSPGLIYYDLPYSRADVDGQKPLDKGVSGTAEQG